MPQVGDITVISSESPRGHGLGSSYHVYFVRIAVYKDDFG